MLSSRYHLGSLIAVFLALGIGMFIGGLLGERFYSGTENRVLQMMMEKYEQRTEQNEALQHELTYFKRFSQYAVSSVKNKKMIVLTNETEEDELERGLNKLGFELTKVSPNEMLLQSEEEQKAVDQLIKSADIILAKEKRDAYLVRRKSIAAAIKAPKLSIRATDLSDAEPASPYVIDLSPAKGEFDDPAQIAGLLDFIEQVLEGSVDGTLGIYRYTRME